MATMTAYSFLFPDPDGECYGDYMRVPRSSRAPSDQPVVEELHSPEEKTSYFPPLEQGMHPFPDCNQYQHQGGCQIVLHQHYEGSRGNILRCKTCGRTFSSRRCGMLYKSRLSNKVVEEIIDHYHHGDSIRHTAYHLGLNRGTVRRYYRLIEEQGDQ